MNAVLEQIAKDTRDTLAQIQTDLRSLRTETKADLTRLDTRLRDVEVSNGRLEGKIDALTETIVGQTSAALAKLPRWWQMPAAIGATVVLLMVLYAGYRYLLSVYGR